MIIIHLSKSTTQYTFLPKCLHGPVNEGIRSNAYASRNTVPRCNTLNLKRKKIQKNYEKTQKYYIYIKSKEKIRESKKKNFLANQRIRRYQRKKAKKISFFVSI